MNKKKFIKSLVLILWMGIIFAFSSQANSGTTTQNILEASLPFFELQLIETLNFIIRKLAHLTEYFILTLLVVSLLKEYTKSERKIIILSLIFCFLYACTDEYHQSFISGRTATLRDVFIDTTGGIIYLIIYYFSKTKLNFSTKKC